MRFPRKINLCVPSHNIIVSKRVVKRVSAPELWRDPLEISAKFRVHHVEETVPVWTGCESIIDPIELGVVSLKDSRFAQLQIF